MDMEPAICAITKAESIENTDVITMRNINKSYRMGTQSLHVLKDVSLTVKQGEYLAILGPSGSGKSTLMNIIGCMDVMDKLSAGWRGNRTGEGKGTGKNPESENRFHFSEISSDSDLQRAAEYRYAASDARNGACGSAGDEYGYD